MTQVFSTYSFSFCTFPTVFQNEILKFSRRDFSKNVFKCAKSTFHIMKTIIKEELKMDMNIIILAVLLGVLLCIIVTSVIVAIVMECKIHKELNNIVEILLDDYEEEP